MRIMRRKLVIVMNEKEQVRSAKDRLKNRWIPFVKAIWRLFLTRKILLDR